MPAKTDKEIIKQLEEGIEYQRGKIEFLEEEIEDLTIEIEELKEDLAVWEKTTPFGHY